MSDLVLDSFKVAVSKLQLPRLTDLDSFKVTVSKLQPKLLVFSHTVSDITSSNKSIVL